jgi:hypothetical protein
MLRAEVALEEEAVRNVAEEGPFRSFWSRGLPGPRCRALLLPTAHGHGTGEALPKARGQQSDVLQQLYHH